MKSINQMIQEKKIDSQGFTLLEVLFALAILGFGLLGAASMQYSASSYNRSSRDGTEASVVASDRAERLMSLTWDNLPPGASETMVGRFRVTWNVTERDISNPPDATFDVKDIVVNVISQSGKNLFVLNSLKAREVR